MLKEFRTVYEGGESEIIEKKSRFIASVQPVESEEAANTFIETIKKKHWNATHNCFAYVCGEGVEVQRCSDDGEPSGTAGRPILDVLLGEKIHNVVVVVTRYFGGTLLGTGGLVRAYSSATKAGLEKSCIITKQYGRKILIDTDYVGLGKIQYIIGQRGIAVLNTIYTERVTIEVLVAEVEQEELRKEIIEGTNGQAIISQKQYSYFAKVGEKVIVF